MNQDKKSKIKRSIESSPIRQEDGKWTVHFAENGKPIGVVHVFNGWTESGWDDAISEDVQIECERHAVRQFEAVMVERVRQMFVAEVPPGVHVGIIPVRLNPNEDLPPTRR